MTESERSLSIGEAAEAVGATTRTLRYYDQLGLLSPARPSATSQRRYGPAELARLRQIRELQGLLGLDLDEIGEYLGAYDRLDEIKAEFRAGPPAGRRDEIVAEAIELLGRLRARAVDRADRLDDFITGLDERIARARSLRPERALAAR